jgi:hypothetical protein
VKPACPAARIRYGFSRAGCEFGADFRQFATSGGVAAGRCAELLEIFDLDSKGWNEAWDELPEFQRDVFASQSYYRAFSILDRSAGALCAVFRNPCGIIVYPFFRRSLSEIEWLDAPEGTGDLMTAYGYGGIYGNTENRDLLDEFMRLFGERCREWRVVAELIRLNPLLGAHLHLSRHYRVQTGNRQVIVDLQRSDEEIWRSYRQNNRKNVNKALRSGVEVVAEDVGGPLFNDFLEIYRTTMLRRSAQEKFIFPQAFYDQLKTGLPRNSHMFYSVLEGTTVSVEMVLSSETAVYSFLGGTRDECFDVRPNNLLKHEIIKWARERGYRSFLLGGGPAGEDGIFEFKRSFAPEGVVDFHIASRIHDEGTYLKLMERCAANPITSVPEAERYLLRWRFGE